MGAYFFDTYALIEVIENNPNYSKYAAEKLLTFRFNLIELYYHYYRFEGEEAAKNIYFKLKPGVANIPDEVIFEAMKFKKENNKKNFSYVDCLGYVYAKKKGLRFLTGDKAFKGMKNVEYVK